MAGRINCFMNLHLLHSNSAQSLSPLLKTSSKISCFHEFKRKRTEDETKQQSKNKCSLALGVAATVFVGTIQISDVASVEAAIMESSGKEIAVAAKPPRKWSDKRTCPPWLKNSREIIVQENLPRPSGHRLLELAGFIKGDAPPVSAVVTRAKRGACFSV